MENKINHTPTPWEIYGDDGTQIWTLDDTFLGSTTRGDAGREKNKGNAAFIVRAVNAHDELVHAVKFAKNVIDNACGQLSGDEAKRIHSMMAKALAKAEGK